MLKIGADSHWAALVLTCPNKNSSLEYKKELEKRQAKGLIHPDTLILCIEDPEKPIGSGGATLNGLTVLIEALSCRLSPKCYQADILKGKHILMMHMGRQYPFDLVGKAFSTLPFQNKHTNELLTNFDLLFGTMSRSVARLGTDSPNSPGLYICSTDILLLALDNEQVTIGDNEQICVLSTLANREVVKANGIYELAKDGKTVDCIHYLPDDVLFSRMDESSKDERLYNLVSGVVFLSHEVTETLYDLTSYSPLDSCSYVGIDSGASPLCLSIFFDILLACCKGITKSEYVSGSFKTNHNVPQNQLAVLCQARKTLWKSMQRFSISNVTLSAAVKQVYFNSETFAHRRCLFEKQDEYDAETTFKPLERHLASGNIRYLNSNICSQTKLNCATSCPKMTLVNCHLEHADLTVDDGIIMANCAIKSCQIRIGKNCYLSDLHWENQTVRIPDNLVIQSLPIKLDGFNERIKLTVVFGVHDNLSRPFAKGAAVDWRIMNETWSEFSARTSITEADLWSPQTAEKSLWNAKLYPLMNASLSKADTDTLSQFFWLDSHNTGRLSRDLASKWRNSLRLSLEDILEIISLDAMFQQRRLIFNRINSKHLVNSIVSNTCIPFRNLIRNAIYDGYADELLKLLDEAAIRNANDLILLPRMMAFISIVLYEMAIGFNGIRSGPNSNTKWASAFERIELGEYEQAIIELSKERKNWTHRNDLLIRASRHYEGAMLAFIRQATSSFKTLTDRFKLHPFDRTKIPKSYEWVQANSPARLDLAGSWSDTPPLSYEVIGGSCVTNVAILVNGKKPIGSKAKITSEKTPGGGFFVQVLTKDSPDDPDENCEVSLKFTSIDEFREYNKPQALACLVKAVCVFAGLIDLSNTSVSLSEQLESKLHGSMVIHTWTGLPMGSGLGTSSILIGCVLKVIWFLLGVHASKETLSYSIIVIEQMMTTNGGWQDQVGAIWGGFKITFGENKLPLEINVRTIQIDEQFLKIINQHLVLVYTGLTRLAKDVLINVLRNWYSISAEIYENVKKLVKNGKDCAHALETGNLEAFGKCVGLHRRHKLVMAPGSEPETVQRLFSLLDPYFHGMAMAGAGGGGFIYGIIKEGNKETVRRVLAQNSDLKAELYEAEVSKDGLEFLFI